jgi:membrane fusion protein (multidrug efflux system)
MSNKYFMLFATLLCSSIFFTACQSSSEDHNHNNEIKKLPVVPIIKKDTLLSVEYVADIQSTRNIEIRPRTAGILDKMYIKEGQSVTANQLLFKINDSELQIDLSRTNAAYNSAKAEENVVKVELDRVKTLVDKKVIPQSELDLVKAKYNAASAKVEQALAEKNAVAKRISYTEIRAPFSGIVDRILLKEGSVVNESSLLTTVSDVSSMYAYFNVSEKIYFDMMINGGEDEVEKVTLLLPNGTPYQHQGVITPAESEIDATTGSIAYKVVFPNPEKLLRHGASGKLILDQPIRDAFLVPQRSVVEIQDKYYVFVVDGQNKVKMQGIMPFNRVANYYIVITGLTGNETIVYEGVNQLREGEVIEPVSTTTL